MVLRLVFARIRLMSAYTTFYLRHRTNAKHSVEGLVITRREFTCTHSLPISSIRIVPFSLSRVPYH